MRAQTLLQNVKEQNMRIECEKKIQKRRKKVNEMPSPNLFNWGHLCKHCKQSLSQK